MNQYPKSSKPFKKKDKGDSNANEFNNFRTNNKSQNYIYDSINYQNFQPPNAQNMQYQPRTSFDPYNSQKKPNQFPNYPQNQINSYKQSNPFQYSPHSEVSQITPDENNDYPKKITQFLSLKKIDNFEFDESNNEFNDNEEKEKIDDQFANEEAENLIFISDYYISMNFPSIYMLENSIPCLKFYLKSPKINVIQRDGVYYFLDKINPFKTQEIKDTIERFDDFQQNSDYIKFIFDSDSFSFTKTFELSYLFTILIEEVKKKFISIEIFHKDSKTYYDYFEFLGKKSQKIKNDLKKEDLKKYFIIIFIYAKFGYGPIKIKEAKRELENRLNFLKRENDIFCFEISFQEINILKKEAILILNEARKLCSAYINIDLNNLSEISKMQAGILIKKEWFKNFEASKNIKLMSFIIFLDKFISKFMMIELYLLNDEKVMIYELFLKDEIELYCKKNGISIQLDLYRKKLITSKPNTILNILEKKLQNYNSDYFEINHKFNLLDPMIKIEKIYDDLIKFFEINFLNDLKNILEEININEGKEIKICFDENKSLKKQNSTNILFKFLLFKNANYKNFQTKKTEIIKIIEKFLSKFEIRTFQTIGHLNLNIDQIRADYNCEIIEKKEFENKIFIFGKSKNCKECQNFLNDVKKNIFVKTAIQLKDNFTNQILLKNLKEKLKEELIINKDEKIKYENGNFYFYSYDSNIQEKIKKINKFSNNLIENSYLSIENLYANYYEIMENDDNLMKELEKQQTKIIYKTEENKNINIEFRLKEKKFEIIQGGIENQNVDAIINPHSIALMTTINQTEGINKKILIEAGEKYKQEIDNIKSSNNKINFNDIFITTSGNLKKCKNILNIITPSYTDAQFFTRNLTDCYIKILMKCEIQGFESISIPLIGCGVFGFEEKAVFKILLTVLQERYFTNEASTLKYISLIEIDKTKIEKIKNLCKEIKEKSKIFERKITYNWSWIMDNTEFSNYDEFVNSKIDKEYEDFINKKNNGIITIDFNILLVPGTHSFDLNKMIITEKSKGSNEILEEKNGLWYHNKTLYSNEICEHLFIKKQIKEMNFELFLNHYIIDFNSMIQINSVSNYKREIKKNLIIKKENFDQFNTLLTFDIFTIYENEKITNGSNTILLQNVSNYKNLLKSKEYIQEYIKSNFEENKLVLSKNLSKQTISKLMNSIKEENIYLERDLKNDLIIKIAGLKTSISKIMQFLYNSETSYGIDETLPWDENDSDFKLIELKNNDPEYKTVCNSFNKTLSSKTITKISKVQNKDLFCNFRREVQQKKNIKQKYNIKFEEINMEKFLWHGTSNKDPFELIDEPSNALSLQYARDTCMWGRGLYFAENAEYSHNYSFTKNQRRYLLFCKVFVGISIPLPPNSDIKEPPFLNQDKKIRYDSIEGKTGGSTVYILYFNNSNYPNYLVEYY